MALNLFFFRTFISSALLLPLLRLSLVPILLQVRLAIAAYDPAHPPTTENFDPAEANPLGGITCLGRPYDLRLPLQPGFDPNSLSVQHLCAKPQYGGGAEYQHLGGFCLQPPNSDPNLGRGVNTGIVAFDLSAGAKTNTALTNARTLLGCYYRCFCNEGVQDLTVEPRANPPDGFGATLQRRSYRTYELKIDRPDDFFSNASSHGGQYGNAYVDSVNVFTGTEIALRNVRGRLGSTSNSVTSLDQANYVQCQGDLPAWPLPGGYTAADFTDLDSLCAVQWSGGGLVNAGGYCHRTWNGQEEVRTVFFSDEMTPRHDWTWNNFFAAAAIRFYCWRRCVCNLSPSQDNMTTSLWKFTSEHEITQSLGGEVIVQKSSNQQATFVVLPPQPQGAPARSGNCGSDNRQFCQIPWPESQLGEIPLYPPNTTEAIKPAASSTDLTVCGNTCDSPSACKPSGSQTSCFCAYPSFEDAGLLGINYFLTGAICLVLAATDIKMLSPGSGLGGRDLDSGEQPNQDHEPKQKFLDQSGQPYICPCNATYQGNECCGTNGMVWLE